MPLPRYAQPELTLAKAMELLRDTHDAGGEVTKAMTVVAERAFEHHDAVHVIFGLGTAIQDEIAAHAWMALATTAKISEMHAAVACAEHRRFLSGIGHLRLVAAWFGLLPRLVGIWLATRRMTKKIAFEDMGSLKRMTLGDIRSEHGVAVFSGV